MASPIETLSNSISSASSSTTISRSVRMPTGTGRPLRLSVTTRSPTCSERISLAASRMVVARSAITTSRLQNSLINMVSSFMNLVQLSLNSVVAFPFVCSARPFRWLMPPLSECKPSFLYSYFIAAWVFHDGSLAKYGFK